MNPFLGDALALPHPAPLPWHATRLGTGAARSLARHARALAMAAGLVLLPLGAASALDLNAASPEQLQTLRGIGSKTAAVIVQERERGGRFVSLQDLADRVRGIGPKRLEALQAAGLSVAPLPTAVSAPANASPGARPTRR